MTFTSPMTFTRPFRCFVAALAVLAASFPLAALADAPNRTISLSATGTVKAAPDMARITTGVTAEGQTAQEAVSKNTDAMTKVVDTLKGARIDPKDIQTSDFSVSPIYERKKDGQASVITGYRVRNSVTITVRDITKLGETLDKAVQAGANQIGSISFGVAEPEKLKDEARKLAIQNATDNAKLYAKAAGVELGPVVSITEGGGIGPRPYRSVAAAPMMAEAAPVPVEGGTMSIDANVQVTWELK